jgi:hypothetical protein
MSDARAISLAAGILLVCFLSIAMGFQAYWVWHIAQLIKDSGFSQPDLPALIGNTIQNAVVIWLLAIVAKILV